MKSTTKDARRQKVAANKKKRKSKSSKGKGKGTSRNKKKRSNDGKKSTSMQRSPSKRKLELLKKAKGEGSVEEDVENSKQPKKKGERKARRRIKMMLWRLNQPIPLQRSQMSQQNREVQKLKQREKQRQKQHQQPKRKHVPIKKQTASKKSQRMLARPSDAKSNKTLRSRNFMMRKLLRNFASLLVLFLIFQGMWSPQSSNRLFGLSCMTLNGLVSTSTGPDVAVEWLR